MDSAGDSHATLGGQTFHIDASEPGRDAVAYGAGVVIQLDHRLGLFTDYSGESRSRASRQALRAGVRLTW